ncbi:hypothetical protein Ancab_003487 [Ancistrocladus abbreviatus]
MSHSSGVRRAGCSSNVQNSQFQQARTPFPDRRHNNSAWPYRPIRPPEPPPSGRRVPVSLSHSLSVRRGLPNFIVVLSPDRGGFSRLEVEALIKKCKSAPDEYRVFSSGAEAGRLFYAQWNCALEAVLHLWELRFDGDHNLSPSIIPNVIVPSDIDELIDRLKTLFIARIQGLIEGEIVKRWEKKVADVSNEIAGVSASLRKPNQIGTLEELQRRKKGLLSEREVIMKRMEEFKSALKFIVDHLEGKQLPEGGDGVKMFLFKNELNWKKIYHFIMRECRRLDDGLPIYAFRREILHQISTQQVMVLIGETGSGKSTQLVQFLADSGLCSDGFIVCTQPRKIAAFSLASRVGDESKGCYEFNAINCCPSYSSAQHLSGKVLYMTDHCLLQHCMNNRSLSGVSCIIIDEAHERSLNTDLLLALVKNLLCQRLDLRLIIMSATADAQQLSEFFFGCGTFKVVGRSFPVDVKYVPSVSEGASDFSNASFGNVAPYVSDVVRMANEINRTEEEGTILAFLTSQMEVDWACERFRAPYAVALALHGKLSYEEQLRVFQNYPGKRKVIFTTNVAETSLTIPGVKYVIDSGMVKESRFEPGSGMNVLRVSWISKSSADQRAGRAGRTAPGRCYRLYSQDDFELMSAQSEPEIRRVHLGIAVLKILALGIKNVQEFDFVDAPSPEAIDRAIKNLIQIGAVTLKDDITELTDEGRYLVKLGMEPRLGKLILGCFHERLGREGLVLAAVMANSSSIFCRVGNLADKQKSDCFKLSFCHPNGDLFTYLSVYKEWEGMPRENRNKWCWDNSINAKSMRRCQDTVAEMENCLKVELSIIVPSYWLWTPDVVTEHDKNLKKVILASLAENVAMYSGYDQLGYEVALTGQHVKLHPSCSLLMFTHKPTWVIFGDILSVSTQYLVCVTAFDLESLSELFPPPSFDVSKMESRKLQVMTLAGFGSTLLKKFCGKFKSSLLCLQSRMRAVCLDERIGIEVNIDNNEIQLFASSHDMELVSIHVKNALECERRWLQNECMEKCLYNGGPGASPPVALFGAGAEIQHLELERRCLTVDIFCTNITAIDDKELLLLIENYASGICAVHKFTGHSLENEDNEKWGSITFVSPAAAKKASELKDVEFGNSLLEINLSGATFGADRAFSFPAVKAKVYWPRKYSKGFAIVRCEIRNVRFLVNDFSNLLIGGKYVRCEVSMKHSDNVVISGIDKEVAENEILDTLRNATDHRILDFFLVRGDAVDDLPCNACEEALFREISLFMPKGSPQINNCRVQVLQPEPKDAYRKALILFDGRLHLEAAKALEQIEGRVLPGCFSWQKIMCQRLFHSSVSCPSFVYRVIKKQIDVLIASFRRQKGVECILDRNSNGSIRVRISANATKTVARLRQPLEQLMKGKLITHASLTPTILQPLFSKDGIAIMQSLQYETGTYILFDRHILNLRIFGPPEKVEMVEQRLVQCLLDLHENKQMEICLRGGTLPNDLMKEVVKRFGPVLHGLKEKVPEADFTLNTRRHVISIRGTKESKQKVEEFVNEVAQTSICSTDEICASETDCPICLCEIEEKYQLENCMHFFCRSCLVEQCESAIRNRDCFPIRCAHERCGAPFWLSDLRLLLSSDKLEELFRAALGAFVASSGGIYRFCPSPDCPSIYQVATGAYGEPFVCGACYVETCTRCHLEYHPYISCEKYREFKEDPDSSLNEWCRGKDNVRRCPVCGYTIEKVEGCNHVECKCGRHICWVCLHYFLNSDDCYTHLRTIHKTII